MRQFVHYEDKDCVKKVTEHIQSLVFNDCQDDNIRVILCIGSMKYIGDSIGPKVGSYLERNKAYCKNTFYVYGTEKKPVTALNYEKVVKKISKKKPFIITVDSSLGTSESNECIVVMDEPLKPGIGVGKTTKEVGHVTICAVVGIRSLFDEINYDVISKTDENKINRMVNIIGLSLINAFN